MPISDLQKFRERFSKTYGEGALQTPKITPYAVIPTGSLSLDFALGIGGWMQGRQHEIWGPEGVGKSTLCLSTAVEALKVKPDHRIGWIDMEQSFDPRWATLHGLDLDRVEHYAPLTAEDVADALKDFVRSELFSVIVVDSIGALISKIEREKLAEEATVAKVAGIVTRMVKINGPEAAHTKATPALLYINQVRANISYGADTTTSGGYALKHATTSKVKMGYTFGRTFEATIDGEKVPVGHEWSAKVERNRVAPKGLVAKAVLLARPSKFGLVGIDKADEAVNLGIRLGVIEQRSSAYDLPGGETVKGRDALVERLRSDPEMLQTVRGLVLSHAAETAYDEELPEDSPEAEEVEPEVRAETKARAKVKRGTSAG